MKKTLAIIALAAPALAGTTPAATPAPAPVPAPVVSPWAIELGAGFNKAAKVTIKGFADGEDTTQKKVNTWSWDVTGVYNLNENNALTLRLGYAYGNRQQDVADRIITNTWSLMPGYRYTYALNDQWSLFAGANIGIVNHAWRVKTEGETAHKSTWGFGYSAELGVRYDICPKWNVFAAYQFSGNTAAPRLDDDEWYVNTKKQNFHGVRIGVGYTF
ncbi:MAG: porin family protein [Akkermansia sp.]|nr:porin family protein [Akkermansia sp.]